MSSFRTTELSDRAFSPADLRFITLKSPHLQGRGDICVYVPEGSEDLRQMPIYMLLHGVYGSAWVWALKGGAHLTAKRLMTAKEIRPAIIAMPSDGLWGDGSGYLSHDGMQFDRWIVEDVPQAIREQFPQAGAASPVCIGGLSMGGYGALSLGSRFPHRFTAISGHSSITSLEQMPIFVEEPVTAYTEAAQYPDVIQSCLAQREQLPPIRFDCGVHDDLIEANRLLHKQLLEAKIAHTYAEYPGGHEWAYWEEHVEKTLRFFDQAS